MFPKRGFDGNEKRYYIGRLLNFVNMCFNVFYNPFKPRVELNDRLKRMTVSPARESDICLLIGFFATPVSTDNDLHVSQDVIPIIVNLYAM